MKFIMQQPLSYETSLEISEFCTKVLRSNNQILLVSVANKNGRVIDSKFRDKNPISNLTEHELEMFYMQRILQMSLSNEFRNKIGQTNFIIIERK